MLTRPLFPTSAPAKAFARRRRAVAALPAGQPAAAVWSAARRRDTHAASAVIASPFSKALDILPGAFGG